MDDGSINWDLFSRKEEYSPKRLDNHGRFTYEFSDFKDILIPHVSNYLIKNGLSIEFPDNKKFAVCLTHDIDDIYPPWKHLLLSSAYCIKNLDIEGLKNQFLWKFNGKKYSPYLNFKKIMELENNFDAKSSFYFITAEEDVNRFRYDIEEIHSELGNIADSGWEVGLHGGYYAYNDSYEVRKEKKKLENVLGKEVIGYRNHYLRFKVPDSWEVLSKTGFKYDTTLGYNDMIGFRNGMCHPFKPFNLKESKEIEILEIPLIIMDGALFSLVDSLNEAWNYVKKLIDIVESNKGVITLLWHNHVFGCSFRKEWEILYNKILSYCYMKNAWMTSGEEIYKWWESGH